MCMMGVTFKKKVEWGFNGVVTRWAGRNVHNNNNNTVPGNEVHRFKLYAT